ncbi:protein of unknown function (DUF4175) [Cyclonatronum proteinivorum]|uniref:DUF4175 domain-containing protein n=1 Tax=Cyclonatronum proteinivorum TaxID=1457365 RepID=A0A345UJ56_9BACT|nr:DUF4175 family protein [Cyclonatronum proteinivorum]AXJ00508.1 protein of unknown function (DUF4175) [Cyclonatronum proteinivorum]
MSTPTSTHPRIAYYRNLAEKAWIKANRQRKLAVAFGGLSGFLSIFLILMLIEQSAWLSPLLKTSLWFAGLSAGAVTAWLLLQKLPAPERITFSRRLTKQTQLEELRYLIDLEKEQSGTSASLREAAIAHNIGRLEAIDARPEDNVQLRITRFLGATPAAVLLRRTGLIFAALLFINAFYAGFNEGVATRSLAFFSAYERPNPFTFTVAPGTTTVEQGGRFFVQVDFEGERPESVGLLLRTQVEERFRNIPLEMTSPGRFVSAPQEIFEDSEYRITMDGFETSSYILTVSQIPRFRELVARVVPPSYTRLEPTRFTYPFSRIELPEGATLELEGVTNKTLAQAELLRANPADTTEARIPLQPSNPSEPTRFAHSLQITDPDTLRFSLTDADGLENRNPFNFSLRVIRDQHPTVRIVQPEAVIQKRNPRDITLRVEARDDYGISGMFLRYEVREGFSDEVRSGSVRISGSAPASANLSYDWDLTGLNLQSADEVVYWVEVFDNDEINGPKSAESGRNVIRAASLAESLLQQEEQEDEVQQRLDDLSRQQQEAREDLQQLRENIIQNPDQSWEQERLTEEMMGRQEEVSEQLQQLQQEFEQMRSEIMQDDTISEDTRRLYEELQQLMEEIDDPKIMELMERLQESFQNMDQQQIREALENLEFNERNYQERLERTVELFKQLRLNADMDRTAALLEELAQQEERLMEMEDTEAQQQQQESIQEELDRLQEKMERMAEQSPARQQARMDELSQQMQEQMQQVQEQIQENIDQLGDPGSSPQDSREQQEQIRDQLRDMSQQMAQARSQMNQERINVNIAALKSIFQSMLTLSEAQEDQNQETLRLEANSIAFVQQARSQRNIASNFAMVVDSLYQVAKEIPTFTNAALEHRLNVERVLSQSVDYLRERNRNQATTAERMALGGLNQLTGMVADLLDQLDMDGDGDNGGCGGMSAEQMLEQMEQMGEQQQQLNQQIQDFINDIAGDRLTQEQMERLDQMARQQNEIRRQLQEMQQRGALRPGDRLLSEFERMLEEMEDTINDLRGGSTDDILVERQQNILSRMLETQRAFDQRDESEERRGISAEDIELSEPPEMTLEELEREIRRRLQDPDQTRFSEDYQQLIRIYFQILQELEGEELTLPD